MTEPKTERIGTLIFTVSYGEKSLSVFRARGRWRVDLPTGGNAANFRNRFDATHWAGNWLVEHATKEPT